MKRSVPRLSKRMWFWLEIACLAFLACLLIRRGLLPGWRGLHSDFPNYYLVARLLREGYNLDRIYDWVWLQRIKDHWGLDQSLVGFAGLTPVSALPILPLAGFAALTAKRIWIIANLLFLSGTAEALHRVTQLGRRRVWILTLLAVIPLRTNFVLGQMHVVVLLLLALAYLFQSRSRAIASGICIALAGALKIYPLLFVFYFAWKRQWREVVSAVLTTMVVTGIGYACMSHAMHVYLTQVLPRSMQGEVIDPYSPLAASGAAFFHRLFIFEPDLNPAPAWNRPVLCAVFYPLWQVAILFPLLLSIRTSSHHDDAEKLEWALFLVALLILSPVPSSYHFVVMVLPVVLAADVFIKRKQCIPVGVLTLLYFLICGFVISPAGAGKGFSFLTVVAFSRLWITLLLWLFLVICLCRDNQTLETRKGMSWRVAQLAPLLAIFWLFGFAGYQRHFAHLEEDIRSRLRLPTHPLLAAGIQPRAGGFVTTTMTPTGYRIIDERGQPVWQSSVDQLSSAVLRTRSLVIPELASEGGSRVVLGNLPDLQIRNAESPAISADGSFLAYIRETKGRGSLRMVRITPPPGASTVLDDVEIAGASYDVRDATFAPSGYIVFTGRVNGKSSIYRIHPGKTPSIVVSDSDDAESGSVSPDGQWLAFRRLLSNRWQLMTMNLASRQERQFTFGDCNAFAPAWIDEKTIAYSTDCGRGLGLTALASIDVGR